MNTFKSTFISKIPILLIVLKDITTIANNTNTENSLTTQEIYYNLKMLSVGLQGANNIVNQWNKNQKKRTAFH